MSIYASGILRILTVPERKSFDSGNYITKFYGGSSEGKDKDGNYINNAIDVEVWGKSGDILFGENAMLTKGDSVMVTGKIMQQSWVDKNTGEKRFKPVFEASRLEFLPRGYEQQSAPPQGAMPFDGAQDSAEDDIPF